MKKIILTFSALALVFLVQSCGEKAMAPMAVQAKVDSLAAIKIEEANAKATADCEARMATEVKATTDSLLQAAQTENAPK